MSGTVDLIMLILDLSHIKRTILLVYFNEYLKVYEYSPDLLSTYVYFCYFRVFVCAFIMVALCNRADHYIFMLWFVLLSFFLSSFFSSPNLSGRRLDV